MADSVSGNVTGDIQILTRSEIARARKQESGRRYYYKHRERERTRAANYYLRNRDAMREKKKEYAIRTRDKFRVYKRGWVLKTQYKVTPEDFDRILKDQGGVCAICGRQQIKSLHVDHNHETGEVIGLLCGQCNRAIGLFGESIKLLIAAATYLSDKTEVTKHGG